MKTFQEAFYLQTASPLRRLWRNARLFGYLIQMTWFWLALGGRVRRGVRRARRTGEVYFIDFLDEESR